MLNFGRDNTSKIAKWWRNINKEILFLFAFLFLLGLFFSFSSTSSVVADKMNKEMYFIFIKHLTFVSISLFLIVIISIIDKKILIKFLPYLFFISILFLLLIPFIGTEVKGSKRWLDLFFLPRFQPVELVKPLFVIFIAKVIAVENKTEINKRYFYSFLILLLIAFFLINQPDLGQTLLLILTWVTIIFVSGFNMIFLAIFGFSFLLIMSLLIFFFQDKFGYIFSRIQTFIDPKTGDNFQSQKALDAINQGGLTGQGMGEGILKDKVPEAHTDYIIAVISEEFGIIIVLIIILFFLILTYQVFKKINFEKENKIKLILLGSVSILLMQTLIHIGVNISFLPTTGMTLPFLSYGGSSIISTAILSGVILNLTKRNLN